ncbi:MAG: DUF3322 and DUF2220 domain-containing protein [Sphingobacteriales bacterium]|nr:MAG: DUF3322 and DUF2220 domain-containing protein [Sphingobacteriales bacterium]
MITPKELLEKSDKLFFKIVTAVLKGESLFPLVIPSNKNILNSGFSEIRDAIVPLYINSKDSKGKGYSVEWKVKDIDGTKQKIPNKIFYDTFDDYLFFTKRDKDYLKIEQAYRQIADSFPSDSLWAMNQTPFLLEYADAMPDLVKVARYFFDHTPPHNLYLRELPIQVHSKFIEDNMKPIKKILDIVLPTDKINLNENDFSARYKVKRPNVYAQIRVLDDILKSTSKFNELALTIDDAAALNWQPDKVFIIENKACFLSFPRVKNSVAIFGEGFKSRVSKHISWFSQSELYCWFDMDAAGFEMLNMIRSFYSHATSFLMDNNTYERFGQFAVTNISRRKELPHLTDTEQNLYELLLQDKKRIEQERIEQNYVAQSLLKL